MKLYISGYKQKANIADYPTEIDIKTKSDMIRAVSYDHIASKMKDNHRSLENFIQCDCIMVDIDNTHSEDPDTWKSEDDIGEVFPVNYALVRSRSYMKEKTHTNKKTGVVTHYQPREKWHLYFPLSKTITDAAEHARLIRHILCMFPFIDNAAIDSSHLFFAVDDPHITYEAGDCSIDEYIDAFDPVELRQEEEEAVYDFIANVENGTYKKNKATKALINTACEFLGIEAPVFDDDTGEAPETTASATADSSGETTEGLDWINDIDQRRALKWLEEWASQWDVELGQRYKITSGVHSGAVAICVTCPWEEEHSMNGAYNESVILVEKSGKFDFVCRHSHGDALGWKEYRKACERPDLDQAGQKLKERAEQTKGDQTPDQPEQAAAQNYMKSAADYLNGAEWEKAVGVFSQYKDRKTGYDNLDEKNGFYPGVYLLTAGTSMGKTSFCVQWCDQLAARGEHVLYFAFEQGSFDLIAKSITREAAALYSVRSHDPKYNAVNIRQGFNDHNVTMGKTNYLKYADHVHFVDCAFGWTIDSVTAYITEFINVTKIAPVVFIDYLQVIKPNDDRISDIKAIDYSVQAIRKLQMESQNAGYPVTFIVISSVSRDNYTKEADLSAGKGSGGLEFTADCVMGMQPRVMITPRYKRAKEQTKRNMLKRAKNPGRGKPRQIMIECTKNRFGRSDFAVGFEYYPANETFFPDKGFDKWYEEVKQREAAAARAAEKRAEREELEEIKALGEDGFISVEGTAEQQTAAELLDNLPFSN